MFFALVGSGLGGSWEEGAASQFVADAVATVRPKKAKDAVRAELNLSCSLVEYLFAAASGSARDPKPRAVNFDEIDSARLGCAVRIQTGASFAKFFNGPDMTR
jgi:hypothetical protein